MSWRERLQKASFRGVAFQVEADDLTAGRRVQVHEYPQRDVPLAEDLGRSKREYSITAFVIGDDCLEQRDALLAAIEAPGSGTLVHPWFGEKQVCALPCTVRHSRENGGMVEFSLTFVEAGELSFPSVGVSSQFNSILAANRIETSAVNDFASAFSAAGFAGGVPELAISSFKSTILGSASQLAGLAGFQTDAEALADQVADLIGVPSSLASKVFDLFRGRASNSSDAPATKTPAAISQATTSLLALQSSPVVAAPAAAPATATAARIQAVANTDAINTVVRRAALAEAIRGTASQSVTVFDDTITVRNTTTAALDTEALTASDTVFPTLTKARTAVYKDLTTRARNAARLETITPKVTTPALVLAYDRYEDAGRESEIVERNKVVHPGFVPSQPIKVLSK